VLSLSLIATGQAPRDHPAIPTMVHLVTLKFNSPLITMSMSMKLHQRIPKAALSLMGPGPRAIVELL